MTRADLSPLRTMKRPAHTFRTITDADWAAELRRARAQGAEEGNELLRRIRAAALAEQNSGPGSRPGDSTEPAEGAVGIRRETRLGSSTTEHRINSRLS